VPSLKHWILEGRRTVEVETLVWARWFENAENRVVMQEYEGDKLLVSTVFLGIDHRFVGDGPPLLFETMIVSGSGCGHQERTSTWDEAVEAHGRALAKALEVVVVEGTFP